MMAHAWAIQVMCLPHVLSPGQLSITVGHSGQIKRFLLSLSAKEPNYNSMPSLKLLPSPPTTTDHCHMWAGWNQYAVYWLWRWDACAINEKGCHSSLLRLSRRFQRRTVGCAVNLITEVNRPHRCAAWSSETSLSLISANSCFRSTRWQETGFKPLW